MKIYNTGTVTHSKISGNIFLVINGDLIVTYHKLLFVTRGMHCLYFDAHV